MIRYEDEPKEILGQLRQILESEEALFGKTSRFVFRTKGMIEALEWVLRG